MAVTHNAAKNRNIIRRRQFMRALAEYEVSTQTLSASQSPFPVGSQYTVSTLLFDITSLGTNAVSWVQLHDVYRIESVEIFATAVIEGTSADTPLSNAPIIHYCYEDVDADPTTTTSWIRTQDRDNLCRVVLRANNPSVKIAELRPTATFAAASGSTQDPANMVPQKDRWIDALAVDQLYAGLRCYSACPKVDSQGQSYKYSISYETRLKVAAKQPL